VEEGEEEEAVVTDANCPSFFDADLQILCLPQVHQMQPLASPFASSPIVFSGNGVGRPGGGRGIYLDSGELQIPTLNKGHGMSTTEFSKRGLISPAKRQSVT